MVRSVFLCILPLELTSNHSDNWMAWQLHNDKIAGRTFTGPDCTLCRDFRWNVFRKMIN